MKEIETLLLEVKVYDDGLIQRAYDKLGEYLNRARRAGLLGWETLYRRSSGADR